MSLQISTIPSSSPVQKTSHVAERRSANFHPSVWGDYFLKYASDSNPMSSDAKAKDRIERLKGEVRKMLTDAMAKPSQKLNLIDQIQRLGIAYHFETEIDKQLEQIHRSYFEFHCGDNNDLHTIALLFRLLRQQGYTISSGKANPSLKKQVSHALNQPIHKGIPRLEAKHYIPLYQEEPSHNEVLLSLAKLDFNLLQVQHQKELGKLTRWWTDLDVERKFPFARDRLVEMYLWMSGVYFEPNYEAAREILIKVVCILSIIDDIYDVYGTLEELELFTKAIERWDIDAKDGLPEYMQACHKTVLDLYDEIGYELARKGRSYRLFYAKEAMKRQVRAYFTEAKWFHQSHIPMMEEYMPIALATSAMEFVLVTLLLGMGDIVTEDAFDWLLHGDSKIVKAVKVVGRLIDDIAGHKFEQERGHAATSVECFMKQHGVTEEKAKEELRKQVADAWNDINEGLRLPTIVPRPLLVRFLNFTRAMHVVYKDEKDLYTHAETKFKEHATSLYVNPLPM
ncbi:(-)-germacrene D synthase-like isoform X5 [Rhodamnia argentea]|uniref:(-)-germacrene D synthase-like isoform X5 n=1 Tax=Rhodamnia argentea TaxID=178133 RepID=A0ABM3HAC3_9MYRT|nr:(-)-germacrene D synthase-like isoform X5 [Rhodamnia argentea]